MEMWVWCEGERDVWVDVVEVWDGVLLELELVCEVLRRAREDKEIVEATLARMCEDLVWCVDVVVMEMEML